MDSENRLFRFPKPAWLTSANTRTGGVYLAGALFALGFYTLIDVAVWSKSSMNASTAHITFVDWIPGICSALGMLVINSIDKSRLSADSFSYSGNGVAWKAKLVLFLGFALLAGGLAGSVVVLVMKYIVPEAAYTWPTTWLGVGNVVANGLIMLSSAVLWIAQNLEDEYTYNLAL
ncbi:Vacuolar protein sorting-associated protein 68 [Coniothyrium glycines]